MHETGIRLLKLIKNLILDMKKNSTIGGFLLKISFTLILMEVLIPLNIYKS